MGKTVAGSEVQSLEVIGIKELAKALVRFLSNLTMKGLRAFENRVFLAKKGLGGIIDFSSTEQTPSIVQETGKNGSTVSQGVD